MANLIWQESWNLESRRPVNSLSSFEAPWLVTNDVNLIDHMEIISRMDDRRVNGQRVSLFFPSATFVLLSIPWRNHTRLKLQRRSVCIESLNSRMKANGTFAPLQLLQFFRPCNFWGEVNLTVKRGKGQTKRGYDVNVHVPTLFLVHHRRTHLVLWSPFKIEMILRVYFN